MICSICENTKCFEELSNFYLGNFDNSFLYENIRLIECQICGHVFNFLYDQEKQYLQKYYNKEYSHFNIKNKSEDIKVQSDISKQRIEEYVELNNKNCLYITRSGYYYKNNYCVLKDIYDINFDFIKLLIPNEEKFDYIIVDHFLEHLIEPSVFFDKIKFLMTENTKLIVEVPDAEKYKNIFYLEYYWLMREHIHHFDKYHLEFLAHKEGFNLEKYKQNVIRINNIKFPNLLCIFSYQKESYINLYNHSFNEKNLFYLKKNIQKYLNKSRKSLRKRFLKLRKKIKYPLFFVWGIGREFMIFHKFIFDNVDGIALSSLKKTILIDSNKNKKGIFFNGSNIKSTENLDLISLTKKSSILITAFSYSKEIKKEIKELGYKGKILCL